MKRKSKKSLAQTNRLLARQWHPTKNAPLTPDDVTAGSNRKVWWVCGKGHEWQAVINNRNHNDGCPYCSGRKVAADNCLQTVNSELAAEWHPSRNGSLTPRDVTAGLDKKVWWFCGKGHEWEAQINSRNHGAGCPHCLQPGRKLTNNNCLQTARPLLAREWHPSKNVPLTPKDVALFSNKSAWWICRKGHEWFAAINDRSTGAGCPYCAGKRVGEDNCLRNANPEIAGQWHPARNAPLTPSDVTAGSHKKAWWVCGRGHEWKTAVKNRARSGTGCPYCVTRERKVSLKNSLQSLNSALARQWHPTKNAPLSPKDVLPSSNKKVWWICGKGHEWKVSINSRNRKNGKNSKCPYCSGRRAGKDNCLQSVRPQLAHEWHPAKNAQLTPMDVTPGSHKKVWWRCDKGHEWKTTVYARSLGTGCPSCPRPQRKIDREKSLDAVNRRISGEWHPTKNSSLTPQDVLPNSNKRVWWLCRNGHEWAARIAERNKGRGCPCCSGRKPTEQNCLQTLGSWIAKEWHPTKNGYWTPNDVSPFSKRQIWWQCRKGHEYRERVIDRYKRGGCPVCTLKARAPRLFETA
jgi:hypothetical protein